MPAKIQRVLDVLEMNTKKNSAEYVLFAILLATPFSGIGTDLYSPALPSMAHYFGVSSALIKLTVSFFFLGNFFGQFILPMLSDMIGRRPIIQYCSFVFLIASIAISCTHNIYLIIGFRYLQGVSAGAVNAVLRAQSSDTYQGEKLRHVGTYMTIAWGVGPIVAPWVGGWLTYTWGWQSCFYFYAIYSLAIYLSNGVVVQETNQHLVKLTIKDIVGRYLTVLSNTSFILSSAILGSLYFLLIIFGVSAPFLVQNIWHVSPLHYGYIALMIGAGYVVGTLGYRLLNPWDGRRLLMLILVALFLTIVIGIGIAHVITAQLTLLTVIAFLVCMFSGMTFPAFFSRAIAAFPDMAGVANAVMGSLVYLVAAILSSTLGLLHIASLSELFIVYLVGIMLLLSLFCAWVCKGGR